MQLKMYSDRERNECRRRESGMKEVPRRDKQVVETDHTKGDKEPTRFG